MVWKEFFPILLPIIPFIPDYLSFGCLIVKWESEEAGKLGSWEAYKLGGWKARRLENLKHRNIFF